MSLPKYPYRPIIIGSIIVGVVAGWTVLIWMPGSVIIFPVTAISWAKKREARKKTRT